MPPVKGQMFRYSEADMEAAIQECRRGVPTATAAKKFGVPRVTLLNKVKGKTPIGRRMGRSCYVTEDIEKILVTWAKSMVKKLKVAQKILIKKSQKAVKNKTNKTDNYSDTSIEEEWLESGDSLALDDLSDEHDNENEENECTDDENYNEKNKIKQGDFPIINFPGKKKFYKFVCIVQNLTRKDIEVMAMVCCDQTKTVFKENDKDISIVSEAQIVKVLNAPTMIMSGDRIKYKFDCPLDVDG